MSIKYNKIKCNQSVLSSRRRYLVGGVDELDPLVGHGEDDGGHLLHLLRRLLGRGKQITSLDAAPRQPRDRGTRDSLSPSIGAAYPHLGAGVVRRLGAPQLLHQHGAQVLRTSHRIASDSQLRHQNGHLILSRWLVAFQIKIKR